MSHEPKFAITNMELDEISVVFGGDDPMAKVLIAKADPEASGEDSNAAMRANVFRRRVSKSKSQESPKGSDTLSDHDDLAGGKMPEIKKDDLPPEVVEYIEGLESTVDELIELVGEDAGSDDDTTTIGKSEDLDDFIAKADPVLLSVLSKAQADAEAANERADAAMVIAKAEQDRRIKAEMISKAEALPHITGDTDTKAELLIKLYEKDPELAATIEKMFDAANSQITSGSLFSEIGKAAGATTVSTSVEGKAEELRKADPTLSIEDARVRVYSENPDLYDAELQEA